jgi:hypothetical protein
MNLKRTTTKEVEKILARNEMQNRIIEKMIDKVNSDYEKQIEQIQKKKKK